MTLGRTCLRSCCIHYRRVRAAGCALLRACDAAIAPFGSCSAFASACQRAVLQCVRTLRWIVMIIMLIMYIILSFAVATVHVLIIRVALYQASVSALCDGPYGNLSVRRLLCLQSVLWRNGWVDPDAVGDGEWGRSRYGRIRWGSWSSNGKGQLWGLCDATLPKLLWAGLVC